MVGLFDGIEIHRFNHFPKYRHAVNTKIPTWVLNYVKEGEFHLSANEQPLKNYHAPCAFVTWPGPTWRYEPAHDSWDHYYISWKGSQARTWKERGLFPNCKPEETVRTITSPLSFERAWKTLFQRLEHQRPDSPKVIHSLQGLLLEYLLQPKTPQIPASTNRRVSDLTEEVRIHPERHWDFNDEAKKIGCTVVHFRRLWKTQTGFSPIQSVQEARLLRAALLLRQNVLPIEQVYCQVGFENAGYFYRLFRQHYGTTPGAYRKQHQRIC